MSAHGEPVGAGGALKIAGRVAKSGIVVPRPSAWRLPLAMVAVAAAAVFVTYAVMGGFGVRPGPEQATTSHQATVTLPQAPAPTEVAPAAVPANAPSPSRSPVLRTPSRTPAPAAPAVRNASPPAVTPPAPREKAEQQVPQLPSEPVQSEPQRAAAAPVPATTPAETSLPLLKVAGIAWQKDAASRVAMVNGAAVTTGGRVSGARVEDILPDRVRFSFDGKNFDVPLGKSSSDR